MSRQKTVEGAVSADTDKGGVELRIIRDQKLVREVLGDKLMDVMLDEAHDAFRGHTSKPGSAYAFLVFTDEGKGTIWLTDRETQDATSDEDAITIRKKMRPLWGETIEEKLWLKAKALMNP